jgi:hypothetical protein
MSQKVNTPRNRPEPQSEEKVEPKSDLLAKLTEKINDSIDIGEELPTEIIKKIGWIIILIVVYIYFQHNYEGQIRNLERKTSEMNESRSSYISYKSKYMFSSKQSEIANKLSENGLEKNIQPPLKIQINEE